jgi:hypothetical protein
VSDRRRDDDRPERSTGATSSHVVEPVDDPTHALELRSRDDTHELLRRRIGARSSYDGPIRYAAEPPAEAFLHDGPVERVPAGESAVVGCSGGEFGRHAREHGTRVVVEDGGDVGLYTGTPSVVVDGDDATVRVQTNADRVFVRGDDDDVTVQGVVVLDDGNDVYARGDATVHRFSAGGDDSALYGTDPTRPGPTGTPRSPRSAPTPGPTGSAARRWTSGRRCRRSGWPRRAGPSPGTAPGRPATTRACSTVSAAGATTSRRSRPGPGSHHPDRGVDGVTDDDEDARVQERLVPPAGGGAREPARAEHGRLGDGVEAVTGAREVDRARLQQVARRLRQRREL